MPDRQSVIERLNGIHAVACGLGNDQCYLNGIGIKQLVMLINDTTELLKAQEPVEVSEWPDEFLCPMCKTRLAGRSSDDCILLDTNETPNFCWVCGQAVKWDD